MHYYYFINNTFGMSKKNKCNDTVKMNKDEQHSDKLMTCPGLNSARRCN